MALTPPQSLPALQTHLAVVGSYLGRARFGASLVQLPSIKVTGVVDSDSRAGRAWARDLPGKPAVFTSISGLLEAQPKLDGIAVCCAVNERALAIEAATSAGISVLTEFPYTKTLAEMDRLTGVADKSGVRILPALIHRYDPGSVELGNLVSSGVVGSINRVRCEVSFPLSAAYALENGIVPVSIDWYDLLQVVACRSVDLCSGWLGKPESINADIDLPHHAALVGRRAADPVANLIVTHERGQSTHLLKLSRSVQPTERYLLYGERGSMELVRCEGEKLATGTTVRLHVTNLRPEIVYSAEDNAAEYAVASTSQLTDFIDSIIYGSTESSASFEARRALETVQGAFASARDGIRTSLPLAETVDVDGILEGTA